MIPCPMLPGPPGPPVSLYRGGRLLEVPARLYRGRVLAPARELALLLGLPRVPSGLPTWRQGGALWCDVPGLAEAAGLACRRELAGRLHLD